MCNGLFWQPLYAFNTLLFEESAAKVQIVSLFSVPPVTRFDTPAQHNGCATYIIIKPWRTNQRRGWRGRCEEAHSVGRKGDAANSARLTSDVSAGADL